MKTTRRANAPQNRKPSIWRYVVLLLIVGVCTLGFYGLRLYSQARYTANSIYNPSTAGKKASAKIKVQKPLAILLLGADTGAIGRNDQGKSDTIIVCTIDPKTNQTHLLSIPRDTNAQIIGMKNFRMFKINDAYNQGGSAMARATVEKLLNVPIDYYVTIDMGGLETVVDALGGIDVDVPFTFTSSHTDNLHFTKGPMHLNGKYALAYARMRYEDPEQDYGRQKRQQQVIKAVVKKAVSGQGLAQFTELLKSLSQNVKTDMSFDDMVGVFQHYPKATKKITSSSLKGYTGLVQTADYSWPLSFQIPPTDNLQAESDRLRKILGLKAETLDNATTKENALNPNFRFEDVNYDQYFVNYALTD